jgi:hypothetical protein
MIYAPWIVSALVAALGVVLLTRQAMRRRRDPRTSRVSRL